VPTRSPLRAQLRRRGESFLHKGTNRRWRNVLTEGELARCDAAVAKFLAPERAQWLERGSRAIGERPRAA